MTKKRVKDKPRERCKTCGFRIRGKNHEEGGHHNSGKWQSYKPTKYGY